MTPEALTPNKIQVINSTVLGSPTFSGGWLNFFAVGSEILFDNVKLSPQVPMAGIWTSGALNGVPTPYYYEVVRISPIGFDIDRYPLSLSGSKILQGKIDKKFPEHHSPILPLWYPPKNHN